MPTLPKYEEFWIEFRKVALGTYTLLEPPDKFKDNRWRKIAPSVKGVRVELRVVSHRTEYVAAEIRIRCSKGEEYFQKLKQHTQSFQAHPVDSGYKTKLVEERTAGGSEYLIRRELFVDVKDRTTWDTATSWLAFHAELFLTVVEEHLASK